MRKLLLVLLLISFFFGYLEWGNPVKHGFLFQAAVDLGRMSLRNPAEILHPLVIIPLTGVVLVLIGIISAGGSPRLSLLGITCLSTLMLIILLVGLLSLNPRIAGSTLPFFVFATWLIIRIRKHRRNVP